MSNAATISKEIFKSHLEIHGDSNLSGHLKVSGAKNSALVLMTAALLTKERVNLHNVPNLTDIDGMANILLKLGVKVEAEY